MWELRTRARIHTSSALMCWAACDRLAKVAAALKLPERIRYWRERADDDPPAHPARSLERASGRRSPRASAAATSTPACC